MSRAADTSCGGYRLFPQVGDWLYYRRITSAVIQKAFQADYLHRLISIVGRHDAPLPPLAGYKKQCRGLLLARWRDYAGRAIRAPPFSP